MVSATLRINNRFRSNEASLVLLVLPVIISIQCSAPTNIMAVAGCGVGVGRWSMVSLFFCVDGEKDGASQRKRG